MPLPTPIGRQKEVLYLPAKGHFAILGTAGSGKTTLAILRAAYLAASGTEHHGRTLLVTFNRTLVSYLRHMSDSRLALVNVENYHKFARGYLASREKMGQNSICDPNERMALIVEAIRRAAVRQPSLPIFQKSSEFLAEEFRWMAQHGIVKLEAYADIERVGQTLRIERRIRPFVFEAYLEYRKLRSDAGKAFDWDDVATAVAAEFDSDISTRHYKHVIIDEGQDFSPEMIRSLVKAVPSDGSITFFGDVAQQIYGHRMSWRSAGLRVDKVWEFCDNYRNSREIAAFALAIARSDHFKGLPDLVQPVAPAAAGPLPTLVAFASPLEEARFAVKQAIAASKTQNVAILFRNRSDERIVSSLLPSSAVRLHKDLTTWITGPGIRYGTYHSAKGLEFDMVILPFCSNIRLPDPESSTWYGQDEAAAQDVRLLYVGVTRAKRSLVVTYSGEITELLPKELKLYQVVQP